VTLSGLIDEHIERHKETLGLPANPEWAELIRQDAREVGEGVRGKTPDELDE
jgi:hypothetical protein